MEKEKSAFEKRAYRRVKRELLCQFKDLDSDNPVSLSETYTTDISEGGLRFRTPKYIPMNHRLAFTIEIPKHSNIEVTARPAWTNELLSVEQYEVGASFSGLSSADKAVLRDFINS